MAISDIFKKKPRKVPSKVKAGSAAVSEVFDAPQKAKGVSEIAYRVLRRPHITEKATDLTKADQYTFEVYPKTSKDDIKKAVRDLYGVDVVSVKVVTMPAKRIRVRGTEGWKGGGKKAIVRIKAGQKIEVLPR